MSDEVTFTVGVDLAADPKKTAIAVIGWSDDGARIEHLSLDSSDEAITSWVGRASKIGIDCALGWPDEFVSFVVSHANPVETASVDGGKDWRRTLAYRETDRDIHRRSGRWPLSVSTDRLGLTAMRCAGLLGRIAAAGAIVDRSGATGIVAEVYPGATLRAWHFDTRNYRTLPAVRGALLSHLKHEAPWLDLGHQVDLMVRSGDAFDAAVPALTARAVALGLYDGPPPEHKERAMREGWIALPTCALTDLLAPRR
jgi:predicted nuclease with RNAse H fold